MALKTKNLALNEFSLSKLPDTVFFDSIRTLDVSNNPIRQFPAAITRCTDLRNLYCRNCKLTELPNDLQNMTKLKDL